MPERRTLKIERLPGPGGITYRYLVRPGRRRGQWIWFDPHEVPEFEGAFAHFECERIPGHWKVLRQVGSGGPVRPAHDPP
jgi:hypothetical protein